jgi:Domain of unknown function (DUF4351)
MQHSRIAHPAPTKLTRRLGTLPANVEAQVQALALQQLEALGEELLDFVEIGDLERWLRCGRLGLIPAQAITAPTKNKAYFRCRVNFASALTSKR